MKFLREQKRHIVQILYFLTTNIHLKGFLKGKIYRGSLKQVCVPGLNCYSCPGALGACPIGSLQAVAGSIKFQMSFYIVGLLTIFGTIFGRFICGWLCPFGLVQDLINKIKCPKVNVWPRVDRILRYLKYVILIVLVILLPMFLTNDFGSASPYFCQYICPSGTLFGGIPLLLKTPALRQAAGLLFSWKMGLLVSFLVAAGLIYRPFCKYLCPLGAIYAWFNRFSFCRYEIDREKCIHCGKCQRVCQMQVPVMSEPNHGECIRCGACKNSCPTKAIGVK